MTQQLLNLGTVPNDGTGTTLRAGGAIINANFTELYNDIGVSKILAGTNVTINPTTGVGTVTINATGGSGGSSIPSNLTLGNLRQYYTAVNVTGYPTTSTLDCGMCQWSGSNWYPIHPFIISQSACAMILPSSGTTSNSGGNLIITLTTALPATYGSCYMFFAKNVLFTNSIPGFYYTVMTSTTVGTVYNNMYFGNQLLIPASPISINTTASGAYTQLTGGTSATTFSNGTVPGNVLGPNGMVEYRYVWQFNNNADIKAVNCLFGGVNIAGDQETTTQWRAAWRMVRNQGLPTQQTVFSNGTAGGNAADIGTGTGINNTVAVNTAIGQICQLSCYLAAGNDLDFIVLESWSFTVTPSAVLDAQILPFLYTPSASFIPAGCQFNGITSQTWLAFPYVADVSFNATDTTHKFYAGQWYNTQPPFSSSGGYLTDATVNGTHYLSINQKGDGVNPGVTTQNQSSVQGQLQSANSSNAFYFEAACTLITPSTPGGFSNDYWPQVYTNPIEHNNANGPTYPYVEIDIDEGNVFALNNYNSYFGTCTSSLYWSTGSGGASITANNSNAVNAGPNINRQVENVFGMAWNPVTKNCTYWLNGVQGYTISNATAVAAGNMLGKHYSLIFGAGQRGLHTPYNMLVRYVSLWGG